LIILLMEKHQQQKSRLACANRLFRILGGA
jgi:hypothetical protein